MIIWSGWGILVIPVGFVAGLAAVFLATFLEDLGLGEDLSQGICFAVMSILAGVAIWFLAKALTGKPRIVEDPQTGQRIALVNDAGSLFFIPTRFWAFITPVVGVLFAVLLAMPTSPASVVEMEEGVYDSSSSASDDAS